MPFNYALKSELNPWNPHGGRENQLSKVLHRKVKQRDVLRGGNTLHPPGKLVRTESEQTKAASVGPWTWAEPKPLPPQCYIWIRTAGERLRKAELFRRGSDKVAWKKQISQRAQKKQRHAQLLEEAQTNWTTRKRRLPTAEPPAGCLLCSRSLTFMNCHCAGVGFWWCSYVWVISTPENNPSPTFLHATLVKFISSPRWTLVLSKLVCHQFPIWGE